ncbi:hypothetical protein [Streptomyces sp. NPDC051132]
MITRTSLPVAASARADDRELVYEDVDWGVTGMPQRGVPRGIG